MTAPFRIALAGFGTVGQGVADLLRANAESIERRAGRRLELVAVSARDRKRRRRVDLAGAIWHDDAVAMASLPDVDAVVELIGGADGVARHLVEAAIDHGKHAVTANKALLAHRGTDLARRAEARGVALGFEASVAGGIPILKVLREGLAGNRVSRVYGILNGTCNYILTAMAEGGRDFAAVLAEAQRLGYAEADPGFDIDGIDTAHKLALLAAVAFGGTVDLAGVHVEGIRHVSAQDILYAAELGYIIKLLGVARPVGDAIEQRVHPCMVPRGAPIAHVEGAFNAVVVEGDAVGRLMLEGSGAGASPTASSVVADLIDIAAGRIASGFGMPAATLRQTKSAPMAGHRGAYYMRLMVLDRPGVIAEVAAALRDEDVSMEQMLQRGRARAGEGVPVVITTHETEERAMRRAVDRIAKLATMREPPCLIRIENL
jgi:homoserine dehydrogenase